MSQKAKAFQADAQFDCADEAVRLILAQTDPIEALISVVAANIRMDELGFAAEIIREFQLSGSATSKIQTDPQPTIEKDVNKPDCCLQLESRAARAETQRDEFMKALKEIATTYVGGNKFQAIARAAIAKVKGDKACR